MEHRTIKSIILLINIFLLYSPPAFTQTITMDAGSNQIINWEKTHTAQLDGRVSSAKIKVEWQCPQNSMVVFKNASSPATEVTFPRPGYYLLILSSKEKDSASSSVIVNVFQPNTYKERLADLIGLMTVDEKIRAIDERNGFNSSVGNF